MKIVIAQDLDLIKEEKERLNKLGEVVYYEDLAKTPEEWLERCKDADIICTGKFGMKEKIYELKDVFLSLPFVGTGFLDLEKLKARNIKVSSCPGCNKEAVSEWIVTMMLNLFRNISSYTNSKELDFKKLEISKGLAGKNITILGKGNIGFYVGKICGAFGMNVKYFIKGNDLKSSIKNADVVINVLSLNENTKGLLDKDFFNSFKPGSCFITVTDSEIYDADAMLEALDKNILAGVADDCGSIYLGDIEDPFYEKLMKHPKVLATPHIARFADTTERKANRIMIDNIESYVKGRPINIVC